MSNSQKAQRAKAMRMAEPGLRKMATGGRVTPTGGNISPQVMGMAKVLGQFREGGQVKAKSYGKTQQKPAPQVKTTSGKPIDTGGPLVKAMKGGHAHAAGMRPPVRKYAGGGRVKGEEYDIFTPMSIDPKTKRATIQKGGKEYEYPSREEAMERNGRTPDDIFRTIKRSKTKDGRERTEFYAVGGRVKGKGGRKC